MRKSFRYKIVILVVSTIIFVLVGNAILLGFMTSEGVDMANPDELRALLSEGPNSYFSQLLLGLNHLLIFIGTSCLYWWWIKEDSFLRYFKLEKFHDWKLLGLCLLLLIVSYPLITASGLLFEYIELPEWMKSMDEDYSKIIEGMFGKGDVPSFILNILVIALLPAIGEELIFRGVIQKELHSVIQNPHLVIFITSVIFSGIHLQAEGFLPKLIISYVLCYTYWWTKSLWVPMILHFFNNGLMSFALFFNKEKLMDLEQTENITFPWLGVVFSLFLCTLIVHQIREEIEMGETNA